jgi:hypothetical protein
MELFFLVFLSLLHAPSALEENVACYSHRDCMNSSTFCAWTVDVDSFGREFKCAQCMPCADCSCDSDAVDGACPRTRCPDQPSAAVRYLQGAFYNQTKLAKIPDFLCMRRISFSGNSFSDTQASSYLECEIILETTNPCPPFMLDVAGSGKRTTSSCATILVTDENPGGRNIQRCRNYAERNQATRC